MIKQDMLHMRNIVMILLGITAACSKPEPPFAFRGLKAGDSMEIAERKGLVQNCQRSSTDASSGCALKDMTLNGVSAQLASVSFINNRFDDLTITVSNDDYDDLVKDIAAVYGKPCAIKYDEVFWCFAGGRLGFEKYAYGKVEYGVARLEYPFTETADIPSTATEKTL